ncbi:MAG: bifunctional diguanylate cyclase/phosphodiesterase, partial [Rhodanobacter sp.]
MAHEPNLPAANPLQMAWLPRLAATRTPEEVSLAITELVRAVPGCQLAFVLWGLSDPVRHHSVPPAWVDSADWDWLTSASYTAAPQWHADQRRVALRLCDQPEPALLLLTMRHGFNGDHFFDPLDAP